jgi:ankyrin repeat protein
MKCAIHGTPKALQLICKYKGININQQNKDGQTALMLLCKYSATKQFNPVNMKILINAGADPGISNKKGESPLTVTQLYGNENAINIIQNAVDKKTAQK